MLGVGGWMDGWAGGRVFRVEPLHVKVTVHAHRGWLSPVQTQCLRRAITDDVCCHHPEVQPLGDWNVLDPKMQERCRGKVVAKVISRGPHRRSSPALRQVLTRTVDKTCAPFPPKFRKHKFPLDRYLQREKSGLQKGGAGGMLTIQNPKP